MRQLLRVRRRRFLLTVCCILFVAHTACSSDSAGSDDPTPEDAADVSADSVTPPDTNPQDAADTSPDTSTRSGTDNCERAVKITPFDFLPLDNDLALNKIMLDNPRWAGSRTDPPIPCGAVAMLETSVGDDISPTSLHSYPKQKVFSAKVGDRLAVIAAEREFTQSKGYWVPGGVVTGLIGDIYDIENGTLERSSRKESLLEDIPTGGSTFEPLALVQADPGIVLVTQRFLVKLTINDFRGGLTVVKSYDRTADKQAIQTTLDEAYDGSKDLGFSPIPGRHFMLQDRYLIEIDRGVVAWDLNGWRDSENESEPSYSYFPLPEAPGTTRSTTGVGRLEWSYSNQRNTLFLGSAGEIIAVDLSDPDSPERIATWRAADEFSLPWNDRPLSTPNVAASNGRLYLLYRYRGDGDNYRDTLTVVDISSDLSTPDEIVATHDFSFLRGSPGRIFPTENRIYISDSWSDAPGEDKTKLKWVSPSEISPEL